MHVALHEIRRLSLLDYIYWWVRELFFQRVGFKGIWYLKMWVGVSRCSGFWNEYRGLYWIYQQLHNLICSTLLLIRLFLFFTLHRKRQFFNFRPLSLNSYWMISPGSCNTRCLLLRHREGASSKLVFPYLVQETWWKTANTNLKCIYMQFKGVNN